MTNQEFASFAPEKRIHVDIAKLDFLVLNEMFTVADALYADMRVRREKAKYDDGLTPPSAGSSRPAPLREREPW